ncbi:hypothetical protein MLD38_026749 [Melastoma candidum]|uniref:Uncharacterized protein n=1 Tax=Melastoma candidum TaxID=119954 RepID=A0ACB9P4I0_9MYRT|nr:hypothetical protein MLD38_026749 [Melastoma candidum]
MDESTHHSSDHRPSSKRLWKATIGILELGILSANGLIPIKTRDGKGSRDAFWEVFDICTVVTIGAFDNGHVSPGGGGKDSRTGKVRIRLSTLESDRVYTHSYLLLVLHPSGVKKMGELHLAVRFTCSSWVNMLHMYLHATRRLRDQTLWRGRTCTRAGRLSRLRQQRSFSPP